VLSTAVAAIGLLALAACSSSQGGQATPAPTSSAAAPATSSSAAAPPPSSATVPAGGSDVANYTKQGTKLGMGQKAVVPFKSEEVKGAIGLTVTSIEKGSAADLAPLQLGDQAKGFTPYYVRITITDESGSDFADSSVIGLHGLLPDGSEAQEVSVIGDFAKCDDGDAGEDFTKKGASYQTCVLTMASPGTKVTGAEYEEGDYADQAPNTDYSTAAITWQH
jgi:hypothetical protein